MPAPYVVLKQRYCPSRWNARRIGEYLTSFTEELGLVPLDDPIHGPQTRRSAVAWSDVDFHAEVRKYTVRDPAALGFDWHREGDLTPGARMDSALVVWTNRTPTEFLFNGEIYQPRPFQIIIGRNMGCEHRRPANAPRRRWFFRQRVEVPQHMELP